MLPSSSPQSNPQHKWLILAFSCSVLGWKQKYVKSGGRHLYKLGPLVVCTERERRNMCVSSQIVHFSFHKPTVQACQVRPCPQSPVLWTQWGAEPGSPKKRKKERKKRPQKQKLRIQYARIAKAHNQKDEYKTCLSLSLSWLSVQIKSDPVWSGSILFAPGMRKC